MLGDEQGWRFRINDPVRFFLDDSLSCSADASLFRDLSLDGVDNSSRHIITHLKEMFIVSGVR